jgi:MFS transporter, UMF1 family
VRRRRDSGLLARFGLNRPELRAWVLYDWANSAMVTTIVTTIFPYYFASVAGAGLPGSRSAQAWATSNTIALVATALLAPALGAMADYAPLKKRMLAGFMGLSIAATSGMYFIGRGELGLAAVLFVLASIGANGSYVFYDSLLPYVAREEEVDRVSSSGYAIGYLGGGILLALQLAWIERPEWFGLPGGSGATADEATLPTRLAFVSVGIWWLVFSLPLFLRIREPPVRLEAGERAGASPVRMGFRRLRQTFHELRRYRHAFLLLLAFMIYNDGIQTVIRMAVVYGAEVGIPQRAMTGAILASGGVAVVGTLAFGLLAPRVGAKPLIYAGLLAYIAAGVLGYRMRTAGDFLLLALVIGAVQGGTQALSRSLFASMTPRHRSGEFFGFFGVFDKFAGVLGSLVMTVTAGLTGSLRAGILSVVAFFCVGMVLLTRVDVGEGERAARRGEREARAVPPGGAR